MKRRLALCGGIFLLMALSNAVVPVLDVLADGPALQGLVFSAYFFGAMLTVLPAGIAADRYNRSRLIRVGLGGSLVTGLVIAAAPSVSVIIVARFVEGVATGIFVSAGLAHVNSRSDNGRSSGEFMASLNAGLLAGLVITGFLGERTGLRSAGVLTFTALAILPFVLSFFLRDESASSSGQPINRLIPMLGQYRWLFYASVIMFGVGGAITGLYPEFSSVDPGWLGVLIALQNMATIGAVWIVSRMTFEPIPLIRACAGLMALAVGVSFFTPFGFALIGAAGGAVQLATLVFLSRTGEPAGLSAGLFSTASYAGMAVLPPLASAGTNWVGYPPVFIGLFLFAISVAVTIRRCTRCKLTCTR